MGMAETLALITPSMQGIDVYMQIGDRYSSIQTLVLQPGPVDSSIKKEKLAAARVNVSIGDAL